MTAQAGSSGRDEGRWSGRLLVTLFLCAAAGGMYGAVRGYEGALHGIAGMLFGGFAGYLACRTAGEGSIDRTDFSSRVWLALSGAAVYMFAALLVTGYLVSSPADSPFYWIDMMAGGYGGEFFFSLGRTGPVFRSYSGVLGGGWWIFFTLLDAALFAFLFLAGYACGFGNKRRAKRTPENVESAASVPPPAVRKSARPFLSFVLVLMCILGIHYAGRVAFEEYGTSFAVLSEYAGEWIVAGSDSIPFSSEEERLFVIRPGAMGDLYGESKLFSFSLRSKGLFDGRFSGSFSSPALPFSFAHVRALFSKSRDELLIVFSGLGDGNRGIRAVRAK